jgi:hypothetical protein
MRLREMIENPPKISDIPLWRKVLIICALAFFVFIGAAMVDKELTIYGSAPDHPVPATGQIYEVDVMHGYIRYVTLEEKESPLLGKAGSWAGAAFVAAFFLWITSSKKTGRVAGP